MNKEYRFQTYDPFLTFSQVNSKLFLDSKGEVVNSRVDFDQLYPIGKKAFKLAGISSEAEFKDYSKGYYDCIDFLLSFVAELNSAGKLKFKNEDGLKVDAPSYLLENIDNPTRSSLIANAPTLMSASLKVIWKDNNEYAKKDEAFDDIENDIFFASLFHTFIEIDNAICGSYFDSDDLVLATIDATNSLFLAESIFNKNQEAKKRISTKAKFAANKRHEKTNLLNEKIREIWATGKYSNRDICAEQEGAFLGMSFSTARKALRNTPDNS